MGPGIPRDTVGKAGGTHPNGMLSSSGRITHSLPCSLMSIMSLTVSACLGSLGSPRIEA